MGGNTSRRGCVVQECLCLLTVRVPGGGKAQRRPGRERHAPHPSPLQGGRGKKAAPRLLSKPRPAGKECHVFLFPINFPHQQPSAFLRPGVKAATGESWEGWQGLCGWLDLDNPTHTARIPPTRPQGLALPPWPCHSHLEGRRGRRPHIPRERWAKPHRPLGRKSAERGAGHRSVPLGPYSCSPHPPKNPFLLLETFSLERPTTPLFLPTQDLLLCLSSQEGRYLHIRRAQQLGGRGSLKMSSPQLC